MMKMKLLIVCLILTFNSLTFAANGILPGSGSQADPYLIEDLADFDAFADQANAAAYWAAGVYTSLVSDLDLSGQVYNKAVIAPDTVLETGSAPGEFNGVTYNGVFDGNMHIIRNLTIDTQGVNNDFIGLFGGLLGQVSNLGLVNVSITAGPESENIGALMGSSDVSAVISNCFSTGHITGNEYVGGLCGWLGTDCSLSNSFSSAWVKGVNGPKHLGGLCGVIFSGSVTNCYSDGRVHVDTETPSSYIGGLAGINYRGNISYCYTAANTLYSRVANSTYIGGMCGQNDGGFVSNSFYDYTLTGSNMNGGGTSKSTSQMQQINTFQNAGWNFTNTWMMDGYPILQWQSDIMAEVPALIGQTQAAAESDIVAAGLIVGEVTSVYSNTVPAGYVITQYPIDGNNLIKYSNINITVSIGQVQNNPLAGSGTEADPYLIEDLADFEFFASDAAAYVFSADGVYTKLATDIDLSGMSYDQAVIASDLTFDDDSFMGISYQGSFDGDGHTITNLHIYTNGIAKDYIGLFGKIDGENASVKNLNLLDVNIVGYEDSDFYGAVCGESSGNIENCYSTGFINSQMLGGICGKNSGTLLNNNSACSLQGANTGGICGGNEGTITSCYFTGSIDCGFGGGICMYNNGLITECYSETLIDCSDRTGGFCGINYGEIYRCYAKGDILTGKNASEIGGFVGYNYGGTIGYCYSQCNVSISGLMSGGSAGGFCGENDYDGIIGMSYSVGLLGIGSYSSNSTNYVEGFCGRDNGSYIGDVHWSTTLIFDGQDHHDGDSDQDMRDQETYSGWDFSGIDGAPAIWYMPIGDYPKLAWESHEDLISGTGIIQDPYLIQNMEHFELFTAYPGFWAADVYTKLMCDLDLNDYVTRDIDYCFKGRIGDISIYDTEIADFTSITDSPIAHWTFDAVEGDVALDSSGNGYHASLVSGVTPLAEELSFNGLNNFVTAKNFKGIGGSGARTVIASIRAYTTGSGSASQIILSWGSLEPGKLWTLMINDDSELVLDCFNGSVTAVGSDIADEKWHEVAVVLPEGADNINQVKMYLDGQELSTNAASKDLTINTTLDRDVSIGAVDLSSGKYHNGSIIGDSLAIDVVQYNGIFDGCGHVISNVKVEGDLYCGLFSSLGQVAVVQNLGIENTDIICSNYYAGSLTGRSYGTIDNCYVSGKVTGAIDSKSENIGALVGRNFGSMTNCHVSAAVSAYVSAGGLTGTNSGSISNCYSDGSVTVSGDTNAIVSGGLVGENTGSISNSFSSAATTGEKGVGGLVGYNSSGTVDKCYSSGLVTGNISDFGGLVGAGSPGSVTNSFWDVDTSGQTASSGGFARTTAEMKDIATYLPFSWDFSNTDGDQAQWYMPIDSYPVLSWKSPDLSRNDIVNIEDFAILADSWLSDSCNGSGSCSGADFDSSGTVDIYDLIQLSEYWLYDFIPELQTYPGTLAVYYEFEGSDSTLAVDSGIHGHNGTVAGEPERNIGKNGNCILFDGINDGIMIDGYKGVDAANARTVSAWIKLDEDLANADDSIFTIASWGKALEGQKWAFLINSLGKLSISVWGSELVGSPDLEDGLWHHVAAVLPESANNLNQVKLYVDGAEVATNAGSVNAVINTAYTEEVVIGALDTDPADLIQTPMFFFNGAIDNFRIYNAGLTAAEVAELAK